MTYLDQVTTHHITSLAARFLLANTKLISHNIILFEEIEYGCKLREANIVFFQFIYYMLVVWIISTLPAFIFSNSPKTLSNTHEHQQKKFHLMYYIHISLYRLVIPAPLIPPIPLVFISCSKGP